MCQDCLFPKIIIRVRDEHIQPLLHQVHVAGSHKLLVKGLGNFWSETTWTQALVSHRKLLNNKNEILIHATSMNLENIALKNKLH